MEATHASHANCAHPHREGGRVAGRTLLKVGPTAGLSGGIVMAMWQMVVGAIATDPTAVLGIHTSFWTAVTSIPSVIFGAQWFHGSFEFFNLIINQIQDVNTLYTSTPEWSWWAAHAMFGATVGLIASTLLRRRHG